MNSAEIYVKSRFQMCVFLEKYGPFCPFAQKRAWDPLKHRVCRGMRSGENMTHAKRRYFSRNSAHFGNFGPLDLAILVILGSPRLISAPAGGFGAHFDQKNKPK